MKIKILSILLLMCFTISLNAQVFTQDFESSTMVSSYKNTSPDINEFGNIFSSSSNVTVSIYNEFSRLNSTGAVTMYAYRNLISQQIKPLFNYNSILNGVMPL